ncbi:MAG: HD domain-containing protein [Bacilli bacterium]|nr:HD domain-containing protein [Bacilli bacterium]
MNIERLKETFKNHVSKYDMNDININRKFYHSYRVMDYCMLLAKYNNFSDENIEIAMLVGLLHDYARFEQWTKYKTYSDIKSIDHGDIAVERLFDNNEIKNYCTNKEYYDEIYDAIKYHNKYNYPDNLSEHNQLLCKIVRDADKLDIFYLFGINPDLMQQDNKPISEEIENNFFKNKQLSWKNVKNEDDKILLDLAMVFDLNFKYSFEYLKEYKLIDKMFENIGNKNKFKIYFDYIKEYIDERIG